PVQGAVRAGRPGRRLHRVPHHPRLRAAGLSTGARRLAPMDRQALIRRVEEIVGPQGVISERNQLPTYECAGLANFRVLPSVVVLPETADQARDTVRACAEAGVPFVARGSGTGLSGGALPVSDGVLVVRARVGPRRAGALDSARG